MSHRALTVNPLLFARSLNRVSSGRRTDPDYFII